MKTEFFDKLSLHILRLMKIFGVNKAVFFGVLSKMWLALAGAVTVFLIAFYFSPELQGYYFTFYSLLALQLFVELGLGSVIIYFSSHEWSLLGIDEESDIVGSSDALSRLKSIAKVTFRWYLAGSIILFVILSVAGYVFFISAKQTGIHWFAPWISLCFLTALNLCLLPSFALLEGSNQVSQVYLFRFIQEILRSFATWLIIIIGGGLWAPVAATLSVIVWSVIFLTRRYLKYFKTLFRASKDTLNWWEEIWPMQWRIAVSIISGYFFFWLFIPIIFYFKGAVAAGQMGITWSLVNALSTISSMWIIPRAPQFGILIAQKKYKELDSLMFHTGTIAFGIACLGASVIFGFILFINIYFYSFASRFLSLGPTVFFLMATILMQIGNAQASYLRAHKKEPLMWVSVISAVFMIVLALYSGSRWGSYGIAVSYFLIVSLYMIPSGTIIWYKCRKSWHYMESPKTN